MTGRLLLKGPSDKLVELKESMVAGRIPESDIVLVQGHPSRRHARFTQRGSAVWLEDLGSANGTFVNERRITAPVELKTGDRIRFDVEQWQLVSTDPEEPTTVQRVPVVVSPKDVGPRPNDGPKAPPPSWVDPAAGSGAGTRLIDPRELRKMLAEGAKAVAAPALADVAGAYLQIKSGQRAGQILKLLTRANDNVWTIGTEAERDIVIPDDGVSGFHAMLRNEGARWKITDQMSANGTFVDGAKIGVHFLSAGDHVVRFGPIECEIHLPGKGGGRSTRRRPWWITAVVAFVGTALVLAGVWWLMSGP